VVVEPRGLRAAGVEPRRDSHTHVQQLNVFTAGWLRWVWEQWRGREPPKDRRFGGREGEDDVAR
jgi:hypothetical protein